MWTLTNSQLPAVAASNNLAPIAYLENGDSLAPLATIDLQANYTLPGLQVTAAPTTLDVVTNAINTVAIADLIQVDAIAVGTSLYLPARNPIDPQLGEFTVTNAIATLTPLAPIPAGLPAQILGGIEITATDYIDPSILEIFKDLPVVAELRWSLTAENHPSGSISLRVIGDDDCGLVDRRFKRGTELSFAGIGFSVSSYSKKLINTHDAPGREWEVSIALGGKWEAKRYQKPVFLIPGANPPIPDGQPYNDPDCQLFANFEELRKARPLRVSVSELVERVGGKFVGFSSASTQAEIFDRAGLKPIPDVRYLGSTVPIANVPPLDVWSVPIPRELPRGATGQWEEVANNLKRINGCHLDYSRPDAIYARDIESGARWNYTVPEIAIAYKGDATNSPGVEGYAIEYPATKLAGEFSEPVSLGGESTQGRNNAQSRWKNKDAVIKTVLSGNPNADQPPETFKVIRNMGMNWDVSGPTLERVQITTHDGVEVHKIRTVYGAAFTSSEVTEDLSTPDPPTTKHGPVVALPTSFWQIVQQETTETTFDPGTRYITGGNTIGFRLGRYKPETDELELLSLEGTDEQSTYEASLYRFKVFPIYAIEQKVLQQFASYYGDVQLNPIPSETEKRCFTDGTSGLVSVRDPNFVEPMFELASLSYTNNFSHTRNPDSTPDDPLPDLTQGEERLTEHAIQILSSKSTRTRSFGYIDNLKKIKTDDDQFISYDYEIASQGGNFGEYVAKRDFASNSGRPSTAQRLPDTYEKEEPEPDSGNPNIYKNPQEAEFDFILCTPGHDPNQPSTSSIAFQSAVFLSQGIVGAKTDLKYRDVLESVEYSATIATNHQLRPFDYVRFFDGALTHLTRAFNVENAILIQGQIKGYPLLVAPQNTIVKAGIDRDIPFDISKRSTPKLVQSFSARTFGLTIGEIIPPNLEGRGNY